MKYTAGIIATFGLSSAELPLKRNVRQVADESGPGRRYTQLTDMMDFYNPSFDERMYWAYGCNCLILGKYIL